MKTPKPIALVPSTLAQATEWLQAQGARSVRGHGRFWSMASGEEYVVVLTREDAQGYEFSAVKTLGGLGWAASDRQNAYEEAKARVRP